MSRAARICWIVTIAYWAALFTATHVPAFRLPVVPVTDKTGHFVAYALLAVALTVSMRVSRPARRDVPITVLAILLAYAAIDEWTQLLVNRSCEMADWYADAAGAATGVVVVWLVLRLIAKRET